MDSSPLLEAEREREKRKEKEKPRLLNQHPPPGEKSAVFQDYLYIFLFCDARRR